MGPRTGDCMTRARDASTLSDPCAKHAGFAAHCFTFLYGLHAQHVSANFMQAYSTSPFVFHSVDGNPCIEALWHCPDEHVHELLPLVVARCRRFLGCKASLAPALHFVALVVRKGMCHCF